MTISMAGMMRLHGKVGGNSVRNSLNHLARISMLCDTSIFVYIETASQVKSLVCAGIVVCSN